MGCLFSLLNLIFQLISIIFAAIVHFIVFLETIVVYLVKAIIGSNKIKKSNNYSTYHNYQKQPKEKLLPESKKNIKQDNTKNITNSSSYLKIYISKKYKELVKKDELNYKTLDIESYDAPYVFYDEYTEDKEYNIFDAEESSSELYGELLSRIHKHCGSDFYATISYDNEKIEYRITTKNNKIYINGNNIQFMNNRYIYLKNKITSFSSRLYDYLLYIKDEAFYDTVVPVDELDCDSITALSDKLKETNDILIFEIPYMEEISFIIDTIEPKLKKEYEKDKQKVFDSLPDIETVDYDEPKEIIINKTKKKQKEMSLEEKQFEEEADLWGLSEEDRRIAKEERMSPADYVEAEEYNDDELLKDEWKR